MELPLDMEYNTSRPKLQIPEYGRNVQKMVDFAITLTDREERNKVANAIINVMGELNKHLRDKEDYKHKLWTHLFIISDFQLDVDSPYPVPNREMLAEKPNSVEYPQTKIQFGHYGKTVEGMIKIASDMPESEEREALVKVIADLMKRFHLMYNTNSIDDEIISQHLKRMSQGKIVLTDLSFLTSTKDMIREYEIDKKPPQNNKNRKNKNRNNNNRNNRKRY
ncbi:MAG: DUF4290 domain-containing protein [Crocinitomicaceae bacterium]